MSDPSDSNPPSRPSAGTESFVGMLSVDTDDNGDQGENKERYTGYLPQSLHSMGDDMMDWFQSVHRKVAGKAEARVESSVASGARNVNRLLSEPQSVAHRREMRRRKRTGQREIKWELVGAPPSFLADFFVNMVSSSWAQLLIYSALGYTVMVLFFAAILYPDASNGIRHADKGDFGDAVFLSLQTFSTIGFGDLSPKSHYVHFVATMEAFFGMAFVALLTGLLYTKFSRPIMSFVFSNRLCIRQQSDGRHVLSARIVSELGSEIYGVDFHISLIISEHSREGIEMRRLRELPLENGSPPIMFATYSVMHVIDENSPIFGLDEDGLAKCVTFFVVTMEGIDADLMQTVVSRRLFLPEDVCFESRFARVMRFNPQLQRAELDMTRLHDVLPDYDASHVPDAQLNSSMTGSEAKSALEEQDA